MRERSGRMLDSHRAQVLCGLDPTMDEDFVKRYQVESSILYESVVDKYSDANMWDQKIHRLDELLTHWGLNVSDTKVNEILLDLYNRNVGTQHTLDTISPYDLAAIRNGQSYETFEAIRSILPQENRNNASIDKSIREFEHRHSPLRTIVPLTGYEIEIPYQFQVLTTDRVAILAALGFKTDLDIGGPSSGYYEMAHGPFRSYHSANEAFLRFARSGIINMYESYGQSVHLNIDVNRTDGVPELTRLLQTTGWAYHPSKQWNYMQLRDLFEPDSLRIYQKHSKATDGFYTEVKEFALQDVHGFLKHNKYSSLLATALSAYHRAQSLSKSSSDYIKTPEGKQLLDPEWIVTNSQLRSIDKKLALAWFAMSKVLNKGFTGRGMGNFLTPELHDVSNRIFTNEMSAVFGDSYPRWNRHSVDVHSIHTVPINVYGRTYPNLVSFSRKLAALTGSHIKQLLTNYMEEFRTDIEQYQSKGDYYMNSRGYSQFFRQYDCGVRQDAALSDKKLIFQKIEAEFIKK